MTEHALIIPTLKTPRLLLEPLSLDHSQGMFRMWSHPAVHRYSGIAVDENRKQIHMPAKTSDDSDGLIRFWLQAAGEGWGFRWAVMLQDPESTFIGHIGFNSLAQCSELAYHMNPDYWGEGLMTEAATAAIDWRKGSGVTEIDAYIEPANKASIALALRLGMQKTNKFSEGAQQYRMPIR